MRPVCLAAQRVVERATSSRLLAVGLRMGNGDVISSFPFPSRAHMARGSRSSDVISIKPSGYYLRDMQGIIARCWWCGVVCGV